MLHLFQNLRLHDKKLALPDGVVDCDEKIFRIHVRGLGMLGDPLAHDFGPFFDRRPILDPVVHIQGAQYPRNDFINSFRKFQFVLAER